MSAQLRPESSAIAVAGALAAAGAPSAGAGGSSAGAGAATRAGRPAGDAAGEVAAAFGGGASSLATFEARSQKRISTARKMSTFAASQSPPRWARGAPALGGQSADRTLPGGTLVNMSYLP